MCKMCSCVCVHVMQRSAVQCSTAQRSAAQRSAAWLLMCYRGTEEYCGVEGKVDIINSTFGKALGGAAGLCLSVCVRCNVVLELLSVA